MANTHTRRKIADHTGHAFADAACSIFDRSILANSTRFEETLGISFSCSISL